MLTNRRKKMELKSKCCGVKVRKAKFSSLIEKKYYKPFYICNACNKPTKIEENRGK